MELFVLFRFHQDNDVIPLKRRISRNVEGEALLPAAAFGFSFSLRHWWTWCGFVVTDASTVSRYARRGPLWHCCRLADDDMYAY
jgi:hypothetical protein